jgi:hypothetical protein
MNRDKLKLLWVIFAGSLLIASLLVSFAKDVFEWRNPKANGKVFWMELPGSLLAPKLEENQ